uniref:Prominin 2 n=1 Tax=Latimeria chalumnae TaxID=7897 RepID=H3A1N0_LATCH
QVIKYEIGFLVCAAIGVIFIVFMPLVGCCFSCCRCCGRCGGRMFQEQTKSTSCKRMALVSSLFIITTIILSRKVCLNLLLAAGIFGNVSPLNDNLQRWVAFFFLNSKANQINTVTDESSVPIEEVTRNLDGIGEVLGRSILDQLGTDVYPVLGNISELAQGINRTRDDMLTLNEISRRLQDNQKILEKNLTDIQTSLTATINSNSCNGCGSMKTRINGLVPDANYGVLSLPPPPPKKKNVREPFKNFLKKIPDLLSFLPSTDIRTPFCVEVKKQLQSIRNQIEKLTSEIPITDSLSQINQQLDSVTTTVEEYLPDAQMINRYSVRWIAAAVLCCFILLIVVCNYLGLVMGSLGHKSNVDPTKRGCLSNSGGNFFMAGTGFSFIFSWLLMILVCLTFVVGGNIYSLVCKSWENQELSKFLAGAPPPRWSVLDYVVERGFTGRRHDSPLHNCESPPLTFGTSLQVEKNFTKTDLQVLANELDQLANTQVSMNRIFYLFHHFPNQIIYVLAPKTDGYARGVLRMLCYRHSSKVSLLCVSEGWGRKGNKTLVPNKIVVKRKMNNWKESLEKKVDLKLVMQSLMCTESCFTIVNHWIYRMREERAWWWRDVVGYTHKESEAFLNCQLNYFQLYVDWAKKTLTEDIGRCKPAANSIDAAYVISCVYFVDSLNAFWFSLGWCTIFLIPSIILSVKLAKFYRRMKCADVYE